MNSLIKKYKLDGRVKWFAYNGYITRSIKFTMPCSGCSCDCSDGYGCNHSNSGCHECGYTGKRIDSYPCQAFDINGNPIKTKTKNFKQLR